MGKKKVKGRRKGERDRLVFMAAKAVKERQRKKNSSFSSLFHRGKGNKDRNRIKG